MKISSHSAEFLSHLIAPCHSLPHFIALSQGIPRLERKSFLFGNLVPVLHFFIKSYQALSLLIKPHHTLSHTRETKPFSFDYLRIVPRLQIFFHILSHLVTPYHTSSHLIPLPQNPKILSLGNFKISFQIADILSHLITSCHSSSHLITSYRLE